MEINGVIFDFDGLILDTETADLLAWQKIFIQYDVPFPRNIYNSGIGAEYIDERLISEIKLISNHRKIHSSAISHQFQQLKSELVQAKEILPGVLDRLDEAKSLQMKIGLASSSPSQWIDSNLHRLGILHYFDCIFTKDDVEKIKPNPEIFIKTAACLGLSTSQILVFEDSSNGIAAAKSAGLTTIAIPNQVTKGLDFSQAEMILDSLADVSLKELLFMFGNKK